MAQLSEELLPKSEDSGSNSVNSNKIIIKGLKVLFSRYFLKNGPYPASFFVFSTQLTVNKCSTKVLPMTGFEPRNSGVRGDRSTNAVTTTVRSYLILNFVTNNLRFQRLRLVKLYRRNKEGCNITTALLINCHWLILDS